MSLSLQRGNILWLWLQSVLYGMYTIIFAGCVYILQSRKLFSGSKVYKLMLVVVSLFICATAEAVIYFAYTFILSDVQSDMPYPGETEKQLHEKNTDNLLACILAPIVATNTVIADGLLIWRSFVVWERRKSVIIVPSFLLLAGAACGYALTYFAAEAYLVRLHLPLSVTTPPEGWIHAGKWSMIMRTVFFSTSLATNVFVTALIAGRIWWLNNGLGDVLGHKHVKPYGRIVTVLIESGAINSACLLLGLIMDGPFNTHIIQGASGSEFQVATFVVFPSTIANIFPTLLVVLVALGKTTQPTTVAMATREGAVDTRVTLPTILFAHTGMDSTQSTDSCEMVARRVEFNAQKQNRPMERRNSALSTA